MVVYAVSSGCNFEGGGFDDLYSTLEKAMKAAELLLKIKQKESDKRIRYERKKMADIPGLEDRIEKYKWKEYNGLLHPMKKAKWQTFYDYILVEEIEVK